MTNRETSTALRYARPDPMHLYPRDAPRTRLSHAEVLVYDALKRCERLGWSAWHSLRLRTAAGFEGAILSLAGQTKSTLFHTERLGSHKLVHADSAEAHQHTVVDTFLRFKGLERPFVFVTELAGAHVTNFATRMHIAATRATVGVVVFAPQELVEADPRLRALRAEH